VRGSTVSSWTRFWRLILLFLLPLSMIASAQTASTDNQDNWIPRDQDLRILEVRVKQYTFEDVVAAYQFEDIVLLPLGALSELLEIAIEVRPGEASGFVIREDRSFFLDISAKKLPCREKSENTTVTWCTCCSTIFMSTPICSENG
jgi:hypothetical protein